MITYQGPNLCLYLCKLSYIELNIDFIPLIPTIDTLRVLSGTTEPFSRHHYIHLSYHT